MKQRMVFGLMAALALGTVAMAQPRTIRATMTGGGGGDGKCTFEVEVDGAAEVEIHGDTGSIRQLSGQKAVWRRLVCNQPLPNNPADFRFQGIDGRGRQELVRDPNQSGGVAVIRISDPKGGAEGYTGDITWRGGNNDWGGTGNWNGRAGEGWGQQRISANEAMNVCRNQVVQTRNVQRGRVAVRMGKFERDGDSTVNFTFTNAMGRTKTGFCNVSRTGQIVQLQMEGGANQGRASLNQALDTCQDEAARQWGIGRENVRVQHGIDPGNGSYLINYQAQDRGQRIRTGTCRVSAIGEIEAFRK